MTFVIQFDDSSYCISILRRYRMRLGKIEGEWLMASVVSFQDVSKEFKGKKAVERVSFTMTIMYVFPFILLILFFPFAYRSMYSKMELEEQLTQANEQIDELIKREERLRIARDLHDTLGHTLSLITLKSQLVAKLVDKDCLLYTSPSPRD